MPRARVSSSSSRLFVLATVAFALAIMYLAHEVLLPLALAALLAFLLTPAVELLQRRGLGRIPAVLIVSVATLTLLAGVVWFVAQQLYDLSADLPGYLGVVQERVEGIKRRLGTGDGKLTKAIADLRATLSGGGGELAAATPVKVVESRPAVWGIVGAWLGPLLSPLETAAIVTVFVIFILIQREDLRDRLIRLAGTGRLTVTTQALDEAGKRVSKYLLMLLLVNGGYGVVVGLGLWAIGLPNPFLWGLIAGIARFVPYIGPPAGALLPLALSLAVGTGWLKPGLTLGLFVVLELLIANVIEPYLYGTHTGVSMLGLLAMATFWTWLWGPAGLVLSMPLTVCLVVLGRYVPQLGFLNIMLGDAPALSLRERYYQRILALDYHESSEIVAKALKEGSVEQLYTDILAPALSLAERDRQTGDLVETQRVFLLQTVREAVEELGEKARTPDEAAADAGTPAKAHVWCVPAEDDADEIAGMMFAQMLTARGYTAETLPAGEVSEDVLRRVTEDAADAILISAVAPGGVTHARRLCRRLHPKRPNLSLIVGLWNASGTLEQSEARLQAAGATAVVTTLDDALKALTPNAAPDHPPEKEKLEPARVG